MVSFQTLLNVLNRLFTYQVRALFRKHMKERMRSYVRTTWELLGAVVIYLILVSLKIVIIEYSKTTPTMFSLGKRGNEFKNALVMYTPDNSVTKYFMKSVCSNPRIDNTSIELEEFNVSCIGYSREDELTKMSEDFQIMDPVAVVVFSNLDKIEFPKKLEYTIRFVDMADHTESYLKDLYHGPQYNKVGNATFFANLQWAIDKAYLELLSGSKIDHSVKLVQESLRMNVPAEMRVIHSFLIACSVLAPLPFFLFSGSRFVYERRSGLKGQMQLYGVSAGMLRFSHLLDTLFFATVYAVLITLLLTEVSYPILPLSNPFLIGVTIVMQLMNVTCLAFVTSALSQDFQHSDGVALLVYMLSFSVNKLFFMKDMDRSFGVLLICLILPHAPIILFWNHVTHLEIVNVGLQFSNMFKEVNADCVPVIVAWFYLLEQIALMLLLSWYLDLVKPGKYGVPLKWNFVFQKKYWKGSNIPLLSKKSGGGKRRPSRRVNFHVTAEQTTTVLKDDRFFETGPHDAAVAIKIVQVSKVYRAKHTNIQALDNVNLDIYAGEITVLLGTNGAGKTTLMSIIAGMCVPNQGLIYINGLDNSQRIQEIRRDLGYCPQRDIVFDYLTVKENIVFFEKLRGITERTHRVSPTAETLIEKLQLTDKKYMYSHHLDSGARRCLQVACALIGEADVLVMDEPTSGMGTQLRHALWDMLLMLRGDCTVFLSTSFMEEADALGDRIALLNKGKLRCHGSPAFLKNAIGTDFKLNLTFKDKNQAETIDEVENLLSNEIPDMSRATSLQSKTNLSRISIQLPAKDREQFPRVFDMLEDKKQQLGIAAIDVGMSMEEVYLRFVEEDDPIELSTLEEVAAELNLYESEARVIGYRLYWQQMRVLMWRSIIYLMSSRIKFVVMVRSLYKQVLIPFLALMVVTLSSNSNDGASGYGLSYQLSSIKVNSIVLLNGGPHMRSDVWSPIKSHYPNTQYMSTDNVPRDIHKIITSKPVKHQVFGYNIENDRTVVYYPNPSQESISKAMNIFSNIFISLHMPYATDHNINVSYTPLKLSPKAVVKQPKRFYMCVGWAMWVAFLIGLPLAPFILLSAEEYATAVRFRFMTAGCSSFIIWYSKLCTHYIFYVLFIPPSVLFVSAALDYDNTINKPDFLCALLLLLLLFGPAFLMHLYSLSFILDKKHILAKIYIQCLFFSIVTPMIVVLASIMNKGEGYLRVLSLIIFYIVSFIFPSCTLTGGISILADVARSNAYCELNKHLCPNNFVPAIDVTKENCCNLSANAKVFTYYASKLEGQMELFILVGQFILYSALVVFLQQRTLQNLLDHFIHCNYKETDGLEAEKPYDVTQERDFVKEKMAYLKSLSYEERRTDPTMLLVCNLHKKCLFRHKHQCTDVKGINFSVKQGECFCLVGSCGSGKTTVLNVISGFMPKTRGDLYAGGDFISKNKKRYLRDISYSTSMQDLDGFLTGFQNLKLLGELYGRNPIASERLAILYLQYMGLHVHMHALESSYTPGCQRRLAVAGALATESTVVLLDVPIAAVDPYTRPIVIRALRRLRRKNAAIVLAESNMQWREMEQVATRMGIMIHGRMVALGGVRQIRAKYGTGFSVEIKLRIEPAFITESQFPTPHRESNQRSPSILRNRDNVMAFKEAFKQNFPTSYLADEHMTLLQFRIRDEEEILLYSDMFLKMENLHSEFSDLIEDYTLHETSLDEVLHYFEKLHTLHAQGKKKLTP